jgi:hypothetical protein
MLKHKQRSGLGQLAAVLALLIGGGVFGALLGKAVAPDSEAGVFVSGAMLPVALFVGVSLWLGAAVAFMRFHLLRRLFVGQPERLAAARARDIVPPGSFVFVPSSVATAVAAACVVSVLSTQATFLRVGGLYLTTGLVHGLVAWWLARVGLLPVPDGT